MTPDDGGPPWEELIVGERMAADRAFQDRVQDSALSNQAWNLVMMAVEFEVVEPDTPDRARMTVNSDNLESVLPAMADIESSTGLAPADSSDGGILDGIRSLLGGDGGSAERRAEAEGLAEEYASVLEREIKESGKWNAVCEMAADHG